VPTNGFWNTRAGSELLQLTFMRLAAEELDGTAFHLRNRAAISSFCRVCAGRTVVASSARGGQQVLGASGPSLQWSTNVWRGVGLGLIKTYGENRGLGVLSLDENRSENCPTAAPRRKTVDWLDHRISQANVRWKEEKKRGERLVETPTLLCA